LRRQQLKRAFHQSVKNESLALLKKQAGFQVDNLFAVTNFRFRFKRQLMVLFQ
jgi:hypothetical protein